MCALCYWMLRAWISPGWALVGGLLAVIEFGPLSQWMNSYWGGAVAACGGCLVFGALPRLRGGGRVRYATLLGLGIGVHWLCRPYETMFLILSVALFLLPGWRALSKPLAAAALVALAAFGISAAPEQAGHGQLDDAAVSAQPVSIRRPNHVYRPADPDTAPSADSGTTTRLRAAIAGSRRRTDNSLAIGDVGPAESPSTASSFSRRSGWHCQRFLVCLREFRFAWVLLTVLLFSLGTNFYPYFYTHYIAGLTCLFALISVVGLERLSRWNQEAARILLFLCAAHFLFWYGLHASRNNELYVAMTPFETVDAINHGDPEGRIAIRRQLEAAPGRQLVFVRYWPQHQFQEWVHNAADIDRARIVWARDLGPDENQKLLRYYPDRTRVATGAGRSSAPPAALSALTYQPVCSIRSRITALYSFICSGFRLSGAGMIAANRAACSRVISEACMW